MSKSNGRIWPYAIGGSIVLVFGFCVATIMVTSTMPVEDSDTYMMGYHEADADANEIIKKEIAFNAKYKVEYITDGLSQESSVLKYRVTNIKEEPVNGAKFKVIVTRPNNHKHDQELLNPTVENGVYTFSAIKLPEPGRWDVMAKVNIDDLERFYNVKADTRAKEAFEY